MFPLKDFEFNNPYRSQAYRKNMKILCIYVFRPHDLKGMFIPDRLIFSAIHNVQCFYTFCWFWKSIEMESLIFKYLKTLSIFPKSSRKYKSISVRNDQEWRCNSCIGRKSNICLLILVLCQTFEEEFGGAYHQVFQNTKLWHPEVGRPFIHGNENWAPLHTWLQ